MDWLKLVEDTEENFFCEVVVVSRDGSVLLCLLLGLR